ncbi:MAG: hypothetical protein ACYTFH_08100 [Planctomycetota bacterium]|jgi:hypothetical protein
MTRALRILSLVIVLGGVVAAVMWRSYIDEERRLREEIARVEAEMTRQIEVREAMIDRLGRQRRRALIEVVSQTPRADGEGVLTELRFVELDEDGRELGLREYSVPGDVVFVDGWTARFRTEQVAEGDPMRGSTIVLLRRIYSDLMRPSDGHAIDTPGGIPDGYAASDRSRFEQSIWRNFWRLAADPEAAAEQGLRVAQGEAVYKRVAPGEAYELLVEAAGGMTLVPIDPRSLESTRLAGEFDGDDAQ